MSRTSPISRQPHNRRLAFEELERRLALSIYIEDFSDDFNPVFDGFDSWDDNPLTVPGGNDDADPETRQGPDELLIPHTFDGDFWDIDENRFGNSTHFLTVGSFSLYGIEIGAGRGQPGGVPANLEVAAVSFRYFGSGQVTFYGDNGRKTIDLADSTSPWSGLAVVSNDPSDSGREIGAIDRVFFITPSSRDNLHIDDLSLLLFEAGFSNNAPEAVPDFKTTLPGQAVGIDFMANDRDADGDPLRFVRISREPVSGSLSLIISPGTNPMATYTPAAGFHGRDSFDYVITDDRGAPNGLGTGTVEILVNSPPPVRARTYPVPHGSTGSLSVSATDGLLMGLSDADGDPLTVRLRTLPRRGNLTIQPDGSFVYATSAPNGLILPDAFTFVVSDGFQESDPAFVDISVSNALPAPREDYRLAPHGVASFPISGLMANDVADDDGDDVSVILVDPPRHGSLVVDGNDSYTYSADGPIVIPDQFTYRLTDGYGESEVATVRIFVPNLAPFVSSDSFDIVPDAVLDVIAPGLLANDFDGDPGDQERLTVVAMTKRPSHGTVTLRDDGSFTYVPAPNGSFVGTDSFGYVISDGIDESGAGLVQITVSNGTIVGRDDWFIVDPDIPAWRGLKIFDNDWDPDGLPISVARIVRQPTLGELSFNQPGFPVAYRPRDEGIEIFSYIATNGITESAETFVVLRVNDDDSPFTPRTQFRFYSTHHGFPLDVTPGNGLLQGLSVEPGWVNLYVELQNGPRFGTFDAFDGENGAFTYVPNPGFTGADTFTYHVYADYGEGDLWQSELATALISVLDQPPEARDFDYIVSNSSFVRANVRGDDPDPDDAAFKVRVEVVAGPAHGRLALEANGDFYYEPDPQYTGPDEFRYRLFDGALESNIATVRLNVVGAQPPVAHNDLYRLFPGQPGQGPPYELAVTINDTDPDGDDLTVELVTPPQFASNFHVDATETHFIYDIDPALVGVDSFVYRVTDGVNYSEPATVVIIAASLQDFDYDGVLGSAEASGPNNGDGNHDGIADQNQLDVTSLPAFGTNDIYFTAHVLQGHQLAQVQATNAPAQTPGGLAFPYDFLDFQVIVGESGGSATVALHLSPPTIVDTYFKHGRESEDDPATMQDETLPHWYEFLFDGSTGAQLFDESGQEVMPDSGAFVARIDLYLVDGERGDQDGVADGVITDPGAPAVLRPPALVGDYNGNGTVDSADFVVWRKTLGRSVLYYNDGDGNGNGIVDQDDHGIWRANFGATLSPVPGAGAVVEPPAEPGVDTAAARAASFAAIEIESRQQGWRPSSRGPILRFRRADTGGDDLLLLAIDRAWRTRQQNAPPTADRERNDIDADAADYLIGRKNLGLAASRASTTTSNVHTAQHLCL